MFTNWEVAFFRDVALDFWRLAMTPEQTSAEVNFLRIALNATTGSRLLDVPCGNGRHSIGLARTGCHTTGLDLSEEFLEEAREADSSLPAIWIRGDMRNLAWQAEFDGAFCFGNSFGYLNEEEARRFLVSIGRALKPGCRFALETGMVAESILPALQKSRWLRAADIYMLSENQYNARDSRLDTQYTFIRGGKIETRPSSSFVLTVSELCRMHVQASLQPLDLLGSISGEPYQIGSPRLILVSERR